MYFVCPFICIFDDENNGDRRRVTTFMRCCILSTDY